MPGPKPIPTRLKIARGNPGKRRLNTDEPQPRSGPLVCPDWLDDEAKAKWASLVPELERLGLLTVVDGDALAGHCQAWAEFKLATEVLQAEGRIFRTGTGYLAPHPAVAMQRSAWAAVRAFAALFGLDPASRSKIKAPPPKDSDELGEFIAAG